MAMHTIQVFRLFERWKRDSRLQSDDDPRTDDFGWSSGGDGARGDGNCGALR